MAKTLFIRKPEARNLDRSGLMSILNNFKLRKTMLQMQTNDELKGWDDIKKEHSFLQAMNKETDLKKKAVYCAVLANFVDIV